MRANVMQVSACVTVMAAAVTAPIVLWKTWKPEPAVAAPAVKPAAAPAAVGVSGDPAAYPVSREPLETQDRYHDAPAEPVLVEEKGVSFSPSDGPVEEFLGLTLPCTEAWGVSMKEFLQMRIRQAPSMGIRQSYKLLSVESHGRQAILVLEDTLSASGKPLPGVPTNVAYQYVYDWPNVQLVAARPSTPAADPITFFRARRSLACDFKLRAMRS